MCIRSLHSRVFIPVGSYMTNTTIRVSKGIHSIAFTVLPDTFHVTVRLQCRVVLDSVLSSHTSPVGTQRLSRVELTKSRSHVTDQVTGHVRDHVMSRRA